MNNDLKTLIQEEDFNKLTKEEVIISYSNLKDKFLKTNKKIQKLEEGYIKLNTELKNFKQEKNEINQFLKIIFPKDLYSSYVESSNNSNSYDADELRKLWLVSETQKENEFQKLLLQVKDDNKKLENDILKLKEELNDKITSYNSLKKNYDTSLEDINLYSTNFKNLNKKNIELENEKKYLFNVLEEKNKEIEKLQNYEIEIAEIKANNLIIEDLNNLNNSIDNEYIKNDLVVNLKNKSSGNFYNLNSNKTKKLSNNSVSLMSIDKIEESNNKLINIKGSESNIKKIKIDCLNAGVQTNEIIYSEEEMNIAKKETQNYKNKLEKLKLEFLDYKEKSHKSLISSEENYNKMFKENQALKLELRIKKDTQSININNNSTLNNIKNKTNAISSNSLDKYDTYILSNKKDTNYDFEKLANDAKKSKIEYIKNIIMKYLETIATGNDFQTKILENVLFSVLNVSKNEVILLEEKRMKSSYYFSWLYNAKSYISSKLYGSTSLDDTYSLQTNKIYNPFKENDLNKEATAYILNNNENNIENNKYKSLNTNALNNCNLISDKYNNYNITNNNEKINIST